ncbi:MBG domain-containing protein [Xanthobacteraceae bacterium A53D]
MSKIAARHIGRGMTHMARVGVERLNSGWLARARRAGLPAALLASTALVAASAASAQTLPSGGTVGAGTATIGAPTGKSLTVNQTSQNAILNWQNFSIGQGYSVNFVQPNSTSALLNRVTGSTPSTIAGSINANGQVYLINPNGIAITPTGTVNAAGFVASSLDISDDDFMAGRRTFSGGGASASVSNAGSITIGRGGYAALIGGSVDNAGSITVPLGKVGLGAGERATLDLSGDGFLQVAVPTSAEGSEALVRNSGRISAHGGAVQLSAAAARQMAREAINMSGTIEAKSVSGRNGAITLGGGDGAVAVSGKIAATSQNGTGGKVTVTGRKIATVGAQIDASGKTGGGTVRIGGGRQGQGTLQRAEEVKIDAATRITADARAAGNGGDVVVWSDRMTTFAGQISAKGGLLGGNGGEAEVSGKARLAYSGFTDLSAPRGRFGNLLLDPYDITISSGTDSNHDGSFTATGDDSVINSGTLLTALAGANVIVSTGAGGSQAGDITVAAPLAWTAATTLTLQAAGDININAAITATNGGLTLTSGGMISASDAVSIGGVFDLTSGNWVQNAATLPSFYARDFRLSGGSFLRVAGGDGASAATAYRIADAYALQGLASTSAYQSAYWTLAGNIDASGTVNWNGGAGFKPLASFAGSLDGAAHSISGLTSTTGGLFGTIGTTGSVSSLMLANVAISSSGLVGALANESRGTILGVSVSGTVSGSGYQQYLGGLVGSNFGTITDSTFSGTLSTSGFQGKAGGLVGSNSGSISNSTTSGDILTSSSNALRLAGLVAENAGSITGSSSSVNINTNGSQEASRIAGLVVTNNGTISSSYATGDLNRAAFAGGLVVDNNSLILDSYATGNLTEMGGGSGGLVAFNNATVERSHATGNIFTRGTVTGGFTGQNIGVIRDSYATGSIEGGTTSGGFVGMNNGTISGSYATGEVSFAGRAGGFAGRMESGTISQSYATGRISRNTNPEGGFIGWQLGGAIVDSYATGNVTNPFLYGTGGGFVGQLSGGSISRSYATGQVSNKTYAGGFAGDTTDSTATIADSFWNVTTSGLSNPIGRGAPLGGATGLTTAQMDNPTNFINAGWNFNTTWGTLTTGGSPLLRVLTSQPLYTFYVLLSGNTSTTYGDGITSTSGITASGSGAGDISIEWGSAVSATTNAGTYGYGDTNVLSINYGSNSPSLYYIDYGTGALTVNKRGITVTAGSGQSFVYGDTPTLAYSITAGNLVNGDQLTGALSGVTGATGVGLHALVQGTLTGGGNYDLSYVGANATVTRRAITVTAGDQSRVYGDTAALTYAVTSGNLVNGDTLAGALGGVTRTTGVGQYAIAQGTLAADSNYDMTYVGGTATVTARPITISATAGQSFVYGNAPTLAYTLTSGDLVNGDTLSGALAGISGTSNVGTYALTQGTLAATANYAVTYQGASATVTARPITITANAGQSFVYGNAPTLAYTLTSGSLANGDMLSGALAGITSTTGVGTYALTQGTLTSGNNTNYAISFTPGASAAVTARPITITATAGQSFVYGNTPTLAYTLTSGDLVNGDTLSGALAGISGTSNVGTYALTQGTLAATANYDVTYQGASATVTARPITIIATSGQSFVYGNAPTLAYTIGGSGLANGDALSGALGGLSGTSNVGSHAITQGTLAASANYAVTYQGASATVTARPITITGNSVSFIYGNGLPTLGYQITGGNLVNGDAIGGGVATLASHTANVGSYGVTQGTLALSANYALTYVDGSATITARPITISATGSQSFVYGNAPTLAYTLTSGDLVNGDALTGALAGLSGTSNVGSYAITQGTLAASSNYAVTYQGASATITARPITISATGGQSFVYGNAPTLAYTLSSGDLVNGDVLSGALGGLSGTSNVGSHAITQGTLAASSNYAVTYQGASATVTARPITISATGGQSFVYGNAPTLAYTLSSGDLVNGDTLSGALGGLSGTSNVGSHAITQGTLAASPNYEVTYQGANAMVTARPLTISAIGVTSVYGNTVPGLAYLLGGSGLVNGDTLSGALASTASGTSNVGSYAITQGTLAASANYDVTYVGASAVVTARPITVSATGTTFIYGNAPTLAYSVGGAGLVNGDTLGGALGGVGGTSNVGTHAITQGTLAASANYDVTYVGANAIVTARPITVSATGTTFIYGNAPTLAYTVGGEGLVNGDTLGGALGGVGSTSNVGTHAITQGTLAASANYDLTYVGASATVSARSITITAGDVTSIYGNAVPHLTYVIGGLGLANGDTLVGALATLASGTRNVGNYAITQGTLAASANYDVTYVGATAHITARPITVVANNAIRRYGQANPAFTYVVGGDGLVNGDALTGKLVSGADTSSKAGRYLIEQGSLAASANYLMSVIPGVLTVTGGTAVDTSTLAVLSFESPGFGPSTGGILPPPTDSIENATGAGTFMADPWFSGTVVCDGVTCVVVQ